MSDDEYQRWGISAEEWRCEVCNMTKEILEDSTVNCDDVRDIVEAGNEVNALQPEASSEEELNDEVEDDTQRDRTSDRKTARKEAVASTVNVFTERVFYREEEVEKILQEEYRASREKQGAKDTNVTQSVRAMKREVQQHLDHERTRDQMVNVELLMKQWPSLGELIMHLVRRVEDLEVAIAYKDKRMEVLTKKIQVLETKSPELPPPENMNEDNKSREAAKESRVEHNELEENNKKDRDLVGEPVILRQRRWFRSTWTNGDGNRNNGRGNNLYQEGMWSKNGNRRSKWPKNGNRRSKWPKNGNRWSRSTTTNWNMKKSACAVENIDMDKPQRTAQKKAK